MCQFVPAPGINGYSLDLMRRDPADHPNGLLDFALVSTIEHLRAGGYRGLSLNFATLRSTLVRRQGRRHRAAGRAVVPEEALELRPDRVPVAVQRQVRARVARPATWCSTRPSIWFRWSWPSCGPSRSGRSPCSAGCWRPGRRSACSPPSRRPRRSSPRRSGHGATTPTGAPGGDGCPTRGDRAPGGAGGPQAAGRHRPGQPGRLTSARCGGRQANRVGERDDPGGGHCRGHRGELLVGAGRLLPAQLGERPGGQSVGGLLDVRS